MSNLVVSINADSAERVAQSLKPPKLIVAAVAVILVLWLVAAAWLCFGVNPSAEPSAVQSEQNDAASQQELNDHLRRSLRITAATGITAWLATVIAVLVWRRNLRRHWKIAEAKSASEVEALQRQLRQLIESRQSAEKRAGDVGALELQLTESQKAERLWRETEAQLQERLADLTRKLQALESEVDQRKKHERNLSQQRQSLESSKTVLELHVQERTLAVQQLQQRHELILNSAGDGICGLDSNGRVTFVNPAVARLTGWSREELIGRTEDEVFHGNKSAVQATLSGASESPVFCRKDGTWFPVELVRTPIEEGGRRCGEVLIFKDITERKRATATLAQKMVELSRSNDELEKFAFVASHDLQEPLRKIQAFGDRLKTKCDGLLPPETMDYLDRMQGASARMRTLIDDLLTFSRVLRNSQPFGPVDLGQVAREVVGDLEVRIERCGGRVEVGPLPSIEADAMQMRQLLLNLIGNALKFQPRGGHPVVKVAARTIASLSGEQYCELTVQDNGIGFNEQYAEKIFAVFQRLHGRGEFEGTGVGLAICRRITDRHQGTVTAKSELGKGATFTVTLPVRQPTPKPVP